MQSNRVSCLFCAEKPKRVSEYPHDCVDLILHYPKIDEEIQSIYTLKNNERKRVICDLTTDGGGWTVCIETRFSLQK